MHLSNLKQVYVNMRTNNIERYRFTFEYRNVKFDVFLLIDESPFILMFGVKAKNIYFEIEVKRGFNVNDTIPKETYKKLCEALGLKYDPMNKFKPSDFFTEFNKRIPHKFNTRNKAKPHEIGTYRKKYEESEKIYFIGWRDNNIRNESVRPRNLEKTRTLIGEDAYNRCKDNNISSCWAGDPSRAIEVVLP